MVCLQQASFLFQFPEIYCQISFTVSFGEKPTKQQMMHKTSFNCHMPKKHTNIFKKDTLRNSKLHTFGAVIMLTLSKNYFNSCHPLLPTTKIMLWFLSLGSLSGITVNDTKENHIGYQNYHYQKLFLQLQRQMKSNQRTIFLIFASVDDRQTVLYKNSSFLLQKTQLHLVRSKIRDGVSEGGIK